MKYTVEQLSIFSAYNISASVKFCIVIPVKNEEKYILNTLNAFAGQIDLTGSKLDPKLFELLILANNCTDETVAIIRNFQQQHPHIKAFLEEVELPDHQANIGFVRRNLMTAACIRLAKNGGGIILTTDGDTLVSSNWLAANAGELENGADAVGGRILLFEDELAELDAATHNHHLKDEKYLLLKAEVESLLLADLSDPSPRHHQHFNGSFAITTDCYVKSGGVPDVTHLEDCAFYDRLQAVDAHVRHSNNVVVHTSARYTGRAAVGLSYQLNQWKNTANGGVDIMVESGESIVFGLTLKKQLRDLWENRKQKDVAIELAIRQLNAELLMDEEISEYYKTGTYFGEWFAKISQLNEPLWRQRYAPDPIDVAIADLQNFILGYAAADLPHTSMR